MMLGTRRVGCLFFLIIIANAPLVLVAEFFSLVRPIVNIDYLLVLAFFALGAWPLGLLLFLAAIFADILSLTSQFFPFFRFDEIIYILKFLFFAPPIYQLFALLILVFLLAVITFYIYYAKSISKSGLLLLFLFFGGYFVGSSVLSDPGESYRKPPDYLVSSQIDYFFFGRVGGFSERVRSGPAVFEEYRSPRGVIPWMNAGFDNLSKHLVFIVSESWGALRESDVQEAILSPLFEIEDRNVELGYFEFSGATVEAELRELCGLRPTTYDVSPPHSRGC